MTYEFTSEQIRNMTTEQWCDAGMPVADEEAELADIVIELGPEALDGASQVQIAIDAAVQHYPPLSGCRVVLRSGDFTAIVKGDKHRAAPQLFALVQRVIVEPMQRELDTAALLIPLPEGGFVHQRDVRLSTSPDYRW